MKETKRIVHEFISASRMHHRCIENAVRGMQIHHSGHRLLMYLAACEITPSQKEIAQRFDVSPAAVANNLKKLEKDGYVVRTADSGDTRFNRIAITDKGKAIHARTKTLFSSVDEKMLDGFSEEEREALFGYLLRMKQNLIGYSGEETPTGKEGAL